MKASQSPLWWQDITLNILIVAISSVYVVGSLWIADSLLYRYLSGYVFSGNYIYGIIIFFVATMSFIYWSRWRNWNNWRFFIYGPITVFFPLVFISSSFNFLLNPTNSMIASFITAQCNEATLYGACGKAFAAVVSSMSLRALPAVFTAPMLIYFLLKIKQQLYPVE